MSDQDYTPHPNSPNGGGGPGGFRGASPLGADAHNWPMNSQSTQLSLLNVRIPAATAGHPGWAAPPASSVNPIVAALNAGVEDLERIVKLVLRADAFEVGVFYGIVENVVGGIASILSLLKMIVLEGIYEEVRNPPSIWNVPMWTPYAVAKLWEKAIGDPELKRAHDQFTGLIVEVKAIVADPLKFFKIVGKKYEQEYTAKWAKFKEDLDDGTVTGSFQAGRILGQVLLDVLMILLTFYGAVELLGKIAAQFPKLVELSKGLSGAKEVLQVERASQVAAGADDSFIVSKASQIHATEPGETLGLQLKHEGAATKLAPLPKTLSAAVLKTEPNEAVFWSGFRDGGDFAGDWVGKNGGATLETTLEKQGIRLPTWDPSNDWSVAVWRQASHEFAAGASGDVRFLKSDFVGKNSIWEQVEYPALKANPNVSSVTAMDPRTGETTLLWSR